MIVTISVLPERGTSVVVKCQKMREGKCEDLSGVAVSITREGIDQAWPALSPVEIVSPGAKLTTNIPFQYR